MNFIKRLLSLLLFLCLLFLCMAASGFPGGGTAAVQEETSAEAVSTPAEPETTPEPTPEPTPSPTPMPADCSVKVTFTDGSVTDETVAYGTVFELTGSAPDGLVSVCYEDDDGTVYSGSITVEKDVSLTQVCAPALTDSDHTPYLTLSYGFFVSEQTLTRREFAGITALFLETEPAEAAENGTAFDDLAEDDEIFAAAELLCRYGAVSGSSFRPDDVILRGEAYDIVSAFLPAPDTVDGLKKDGSDFSCALAYAEYYGWVSEEEDIDCLNEPLTKIEAARLFNAVLGRSGDAGKDSSLVGTILDIDAEDPDFWTAAEAVIPHTFTVSDGEESWTGSEPLVVETYTPGYHVLDGRVYYVKDDGTFACNEEINGCMFGPDGVYTSGDAELDALIIQTFIDSAEFYNVSVAAQYGERYAWARSAYWQLVMVGKYRKSDMHDDGVRGWEIESAKKMLSTYKGNCYDFAAAMWAMERALGYDAYVVTGSVAGMNGGNDHHGWVQVYEDGRMYLVDAELAHQEIFNNSNDGTDLFMQGEQIYSGWGYTPDEASLALLPEV